MTGERSPLPAWGWALIVVGAVMVLLAVLAFVAALGIVGGLLSVFVGAPSGAGGAG
ncbi:hypothetical protein ACFJGV_11870 [Cnuibacter sp. UC19_7]|uniref:hypothetical protein n=1 Tax=Cnuibacter sp. UC19_7 TaxID=3350166 RepID=UPI00366DF03C